MTILHVEYIVIHHSASVLTTTVQDIREWHLARGFDDIGYHWIVDAKGEVHEGRRFPRMGAHCRGHNSVSVGICGIGDNTKSDQEWPSVEIEALDKLARAHLTTFPWAKLVGHRELGTTACPGVDVRALFGIHGA